MAKDKKPYVITIEFYHRSATFQFREKKVFYYDDWETTKKEYLDAINQFLNDQEQVEMIEVYKCTELTEYTVIMKSIFD